MAGSSVGLNGQNINQGDYVKIPATLVGSAGVQGSFIGVVLAAGGTNISGVYLTSSGSVVAFTVQASLCQQLGQASGPGNASAVGGQN